MIPKNRIEQFAGIGVIILLLIGCFYVLRPFVTSILWGGILCYSTWPLFLWLDKKLKGRRTLTALLMTILSAVVLITPFLIVSISFAENIQFLVNSIVEWWQSGFPPAPKWVKEIPVAGDIINSYWHELATHTGKFNEIMKKTLSLTQVQNFFVGRSLDLGYGIVQLSMSVFIAFFLYRDGEEIIAIISEGMKKIIGQQTQHYLAVTGKTIKGVVYGIIGTAMVQGMLAGYGFWITPLSSPLFLALLTFIMALVIPGGPAIIWACAAFWLLFEGKTGWSIFMLCYGFFIISSVDNIIRPYLISRESNMPFVLIFFGVLGGLIAFGFIGIFLGPTLLVIGYSLLHEWISLKKSSAPKTEEQKNLPEAS